LRNKASLSWLLLHIRLAFLTKECFKTHSISPRGFTIDFLNTLRLTEHKLGHFLTLLWTQSLGSKYSLETKLVNYVHTTSLRLLENTIRAGTLIFSLRTSLGTVQTFQTISFIVLSNFKCIFESKTFYSKMEKICVNKLILSQPMRGLPLSGLDLTKQIYK
jgi:hypothetical protein